MIYTSNYLHSFVNTMNYIFSFLILSFIILFFVNVMWAGLNLALAITNGIESIVVGQDLVENVYFSTYFKWILLADVGWILAIVVYMLRRKQYMTDSELNYLSYQPLNNRKICVLIPTFNEAESIESVLNDYLNHKWVSEVIVVDNNSKDGTPDVAERAGAKVIRKQKNMGFSHSYVMGLKEALKTDADIVTTTEADGSYNAYDLDKMIPYLENCDMVIGTRYVQVLTEKGNQNKLRHVWGNLLLAKLIQIRYFSLLHMGIVNLTDVGCLYRAIRLDALQKIIDKTTYPGTDKPIGGVAFALHLTMLGIENNLRIVEVPVTFKKRVGKSKTGSNEVGKGIKYGLRFLWFILTR